MEERPREVTDALVSLLGLAPRLAGDGHLVAAGGPRRGEGVDWHPLVAAGLAAAVVEMHDSGRGVDTCYHDGVVGLDFAVWRLVLDRFALDHFGVDPGDHLAALGQVLLERRNARGGTGLGGACFVGAHGMDAVVRE
jgi:hypothetical protein